MRNIILIAFILFTAMACVDNDDISGKLEVFDKPVIKNDGSSLDKKIVSVYEKYNTYIKYEFEESEFRWNWRINELSTYELADKTKAEEVIDTIISSVYEPLGDEFAKEYLSYKVLLVSYLKLPLGGVRSAHTGVNYVVVSNVGDSFDDIDKDKFKTDILSVFIEELFDRIPYPAEFATISKEFYSLYFIKDETKYGYGFLEKDRGSDRKPPMVAQDFADYVGMIVHKPAEVRNEIVENNFIVKKKMNLVIQYFKDNFGITLPLKELPEDN